MKKSRVRSDDEQGRKGQGRDVRGCSEDCKLGQTASSVSAGQPRVSLPGVLAVALLVVAFLNYNFLLDSFLTLGYSAPSEISSLGDKLNLTDSAALIYRASRPSLEDREDFNDHCKSHNSEISVLGCYTNRSIYLYDISEEDLSGIVESTAAHELLHGIWDRLNIFEQLSLKDEIQSFYNSHPELSEELSDYPEEELVDELHSRIGTEYADLPAPLENHYAKYFKDQDAIVAYYNNYSEKFLSLRDQIDELDSAIDEGKEKIDEMRKTYESRLADLNSRIDDFNACADRSGCFTESEFNARRAVLLREQDELENYFYELNDTIEKYNALVDEYNANVLHSRTLENAVNSNAEPIESI